MTGPHTNPLHVQVKGAIARAKERKRMGKLEAEVETTEGAPAVGGALRSGAPPFPMPALPQLNAHGARRECEKRPAAGAPPEASEGACDPLHGMVQPFLPCTCWAPRRAAGYGLQAIEAAKEESSDDETGETTWPGSRGGAAGVGGPPWCRVSGSRCPSLPTPAGDPGEQGADEEQEEEDGLDPDMAAMMGFGGFGSTKQR